MISPASLLHTATEVEKQWQNGTMASFRDVVVQSLREAANEIKEQQDALQVADKALEQAEGLIKNGGVRAAIGETKASTALPPIPVLNDFNAQGDCQQAYKLALEAWERVCKLALGRTEP